MFAVKSILLLSGLVAAAVAGPTREGRQFLPADITGDYNRFVKQGTCAKKVSLKSRKAIGVGAFGVPHVDITQEGNACTGEEMFTIYTKEAIMESGNGAIFNQEPLKAVTEALESQGATFMVGYEKAERMCGMTTTSAETMAVFVEEEKKIEIPGLITLYPGAKYMIVYDKASPTPCTYFAKYADRDIGEPSNSTPETEEMAEPTAEISGDDGADKEPAGGAGAGSDHSDSHSDHSDSHSDHSDSHSDHSDSHSDGSDSDSDGAGAAAAGAAAGVAGAGAAVAGSTGSESEPVTVDGMFASEEPVASDEDEDDDGSVCFPASATVELEDGSVKRMDEIELGDRVKVGANEFSSVFMFTHKSSSVKYSFVRLTTNSGVSLSLTKGHYLYVNGQLAAAKSVRVGDALMTENGPATVASVSEVSATGLYNPQTVKGDIVVDGVVASTYTTTVEAKTAHSLLLPVRAFFGMTGMTTSMFDNGADRLAKIVPSGGVVA